MEFPDKNKLRRQMLELRRALDGTARGEMSCAICQRVIAHLQETRCSVILSYAAFDAEPELGLLHSWAREQGKTLAFPLICGDGLMEACVPEGDEAWVVGKFGIPAPDAAHSALLAPEVIDTVLVPCLSFDRNKMRLGRGGGFYDRYLPRCPQAEHIAIAYDFQRIEELPCVQPWDMAVDAAATEKAWY